MNKLAIAGVAALVLVGLPVGCSYLNAVNSAATAPARVVSKTLTTDNILYNYEWFYDTNAAYQSRLAQIKRTAADNAVETDADEKRFARVELNGQRQTCRELATNYNANSQKANRSVFKGDVPTTLSVEACDE